MSIWHTGAGTIEHPILILFNQKLSGTKLGNTSQHIEKIQLAFDKELSAIIP